MNSTNFFDSRSLNDTCSSEDFYEDINKTDVYSFEYFKDNLVNLPIQKEVKCQECKRPIKINANETWRKFCTWCYVKIKGEIIQCSSCEKRIPVYNNQLNKVNLCIECYIKKHGITKICIKCAKTFYYIQKEGEQNDKCHDCFLRENGIKRKCVECKVEIYVKVEDKAWKKRCYDCWLEPGRTKNKK